MTTLGRRVTEMMTAWHLSADGDLRHGSASIVQPVRDRDGNACVLKVSIVDDENRHESATLQLWRGRGAAELLRADPRRGALLLERLGPSLTEVGTEEAYAEVALLYTVLHQPAWPRLGSLNSLVARWLDGLESLGRDAPAPPRFVEQALLAGRELIAGEPTHVVHGDLHDGNVLWRERTREWIAIDPKGLNGDPCYEPATMLWNRWEELEWYGNPGATIRDRFYSLVDGAGLDERRTRDWVVVRAMINISWAVQDARRQRRGLTADDHTWITRNITLAKAMQEVR